ncbi:hypothetical protein V5H41_29675, partial [Salmonella enterica]
SQRQAAMTQFQQRSHTSPANLSGETSRDRQRKVSRDSQRQAAMTQFQQRSHTSPANLSGETSRDRQRK